MGFVKWIGRVLLWVFLLPVGIWRSLVHHRKKAENRAVKRMRQELRDERAGDKPSPGSPQ